MAQPEPFVGAARKYTEAQLGGPVNESDAAVSVSASAVTIANGNGDRVGLVLVNLGSADCFVAPNSGVSSSLGIRLGASGGNVTMEVTKDFTLPTRQWWGVCPSGGPVNVYVLELTRITYS